MRIEVTTASDVAFVMDNLLQQHRAEHDTLGLDRRTVEFVFDWLIGSDRAKTAWIGDEPAAVLGMAREKGRNMLYFIATPAFFDGNLSHVRVGRRYFRDLAAQIGPLYAQPPLLPEKVERWLTVMGWRKTEDPQGEVMFVYR